MCVSTRVEAQRRRSDAREPEDVVGHDDLGCSKDRSPDRDVHPEGIAERLGGDPALRPKALTAVRYAVVLDLGAGGVGRDLEREEVVELEARRLLELRQDLFGRSREPEINVSGRSGSFEA